MAKHVVVVGGGLAGLAASIYLARGGRTVTLFEKKRHLGGRAITSLRHGFRFNVGAHAFYRNGPGAAVLRELGIPLRGRLVRPQGTAILGGEEHRLPVGVFSLLSTSLLTVRAKFELLRAFWHIRRHGGNGVGPQSFREWIDARLTEPSARSLMQAIGRLATYSDHADVESARLTLHQIRTAIRGTLYIDEGWQKIVDALHSAAVSSGVNFVTSSRVVGLAHDVRVRAVELGGFELDADRMDTQAIAFPHAALQDGAGTRLPAETVLLAVDPGTAGELVGGEEGRAWTNAGPVTAACLDVALRSLPDPRKVFVLGIDEPHYLSVHSAFAQLTPKGAALVHTVKYRSEQTATDVEFDDGSARRSAVAHRDEQELEALLDRFQPGWREVLVHRRFLPAMTVSNALVTPAAERPAPVTRIEGLYIAGDWVGSEGLLSDAALASAKAAAKAILAQ